MKKKTNVGRMKRRKKKGRKRKKRGWKEERKIDLKKKRMKRQNN